MIEGLIKEIRGMLSQTGLDKQPLNSLTYTRFVLKFNDLHCAAINTSGRSEVLDEFVRLYYEDFIGFVELIIEILQHPKSHKSGPHSWLTTTHGLVAYSSEAYGNEVINLLKMVKLLIKDVAQADQEYWKQQAENDERKKAEAIEEDDDQQQDDQVEADNNEQEEDGSDSEEVVESAEQQPVDELDKLDTNAFLAEIDKRVARFKARKMQAQQEAAQNRILAQRPESDEKTAPAVVTTWACPCCATVNVVKDALCKQCGTQNKDQEAKPTRPEEKEKKDDQEPEAAPAPAPVIDDAELAKKLQEEATAADNQQAEDEKAARDLAAGREAAPAPAPAPAPKKDDSGCLLS
jgi:hypothetical protein